MFRIPILQLARHSRSTAFKSITTQTTRTTSSYITRTSQIRAFSTTQSPNMTQKEAFLSVKDDTLNPDIRDTEIPKPGEDEILIKVNVAGTNPKDWKYVFYSPDKPQNSGDDVAGVVAEVGSKVVGFHKGDRVAGFHVMHSPHGAFAEYAIVPAHTSFLIPPNISDEEAATLPLTVMTAAVGLHCRLGLPTPWHPARTPLPFLVYGGSSSNGLFALKLARLSGLSPIITIAGGSADVIKAGNYADVIIDYRNTPDIPAAIIAALKGLELRHAYDAISEHGSPIIVSKAMTSGGTISCVLPVEEADLANGVKHNRTYVGSVHHSYKGMIPEEDVLQDREYAYVMYKYITRVLENGKLKGHPYEVIEGGLDGLADALLTLKAKKVTGKKLVLRIADSKGVGKSQL